MKIIEVEILKPNEALDAVVDTCQRMEAGEDITPRLAFGSIRDLFAALTEKRLELMRHIAVHDQLNTRQLAQQLERDYKNVHTDVAALTDLGLLEKNSKGILSAPYDEIVIHASIRDAA